jgi:hypothetical protein
MTDSDGRYEANGLSDGTYTLTVNADGSRAKRTVEVSGDTAFDVLLGAGRVSGVVVDDETGDPLDGANVQADSGKEDGVHRIPGALTDSSGAYEIVDLPSGEYRVTAARSSYASRTEGVTVGEDGARLDLRLRKGGGLPLHAFDAIAGLPLRSVDALAFASDGTLAFHGGVSLDETGRGEVPSLSGGTFALRLFANGYAPRALVASSPGPPVEAALSPGGLVEVRGPEPLSGQVLGADGGLYLSSPWQLDGRLAVRAPLTVWDHFAPGAYRFVAGERSWNFTVEEGKTTTLELK